MTPEANDITLIEQYLNQELPEPGKTMVEQRIQQDPEFAQMVQQHRFIEELIIDRGLLELKQKIKAGKYGDQSNNGLKLYSISAILIIISALGTYYFLGSKDQTTSIVHLSTKVHQEPIPVQEVHTTSKSQNEVAHKLTSTLAIVKPIQRSPIQAPQETKTEALEKAPNELEKAMPSEQKTTQNQTITLPKEEPKVVVSRNKENIKEEQATVVSTEKPQESDTDELEYLFNPSQGQVWLFPISEGQNAQVIVLGKTGEVIYKTQITNGLPNSWNGLSNTGSELGMGSYPFIITFDTGKIMQGFVTIQR